MIGSTLDWNLLESDERFERMCFGLAQKEYPELSVSNKYQFFQARAPH
jgi:hypothetical protein